jgi:hypothetical protein
VGQTTSCGRWPDDDLKHGVEAGASRSRVGEADRGEGVVGGGGSSQSVGSVVNRHRPMVDRPEVGAWIDEPAADRRGVDASRRDR